MRRIWTYGNGPWLASFRLGLIWRVGLGRVTCAWIVDDTSAKAVGSVDICQERYTAGGRPRFWINGAIHCDLRQVCEGDDVADGSAVDQRRSKPDSQAGEREAFNVGIEQDCCQPEVKDGPSPTATDISVGVVDRRS